MSTKPPAKRDRDNAFPPRPGSGPKLEFDDQRVRSTPLEPRTDEPGEPEPKTEEPKVPEIEQPTAPAIVEPKVEESKVKVESVEAIDAGVTETAPQHTL